MNFCERCSSLELFFTLYHRNWFESSVDDRIVTFKYSQGTDIGRANLSLALHSYHEEQRVRQSLRAGILPPSVSPLKSRISLRKANEATKGEIIHPIPEEVYRPIREIVEGTMPTPSIDTATKVTDYTVEDYYNLWLEFSTLMLVHDAACDDRCEFQSPSRVLEGRVLSITLDELVQLLTRKTALPRDVAKNILTELILNTGTNRPDILVQPLIAWTPSLLLVAPLLIFSSNWEVCLLRNWIQRYPDVYSRVVAQKKYKLSDSLGGLFDQRRFMVSTRRKLTDKQGRQIGDVDVALFDPNDGTLALFEVKWIIEPDSSRETLIADEEILKGVNQALTCQSEFESDPEMFLSQVFPGREIAPSDVKSIRVAVVANGDIGGEETMKTNVPVMDYYLTSDCIKEKAGNSLNEIITHVLNRHNTLADEVAQKSYVMQIKAGGYLFKLPAWGNRSNADLMIEEVKPSIGRTHPCPCGSSLKYKDCCKPIETYRDDALLL
ncbi:MAG: SEC-C metal-binding domain-containing protein [Dehalococcoidales bacterium]